MKRDFFKVKASEYDKTRDFIVTSPSSLHNPQNESVMFCTKQHLSDSVSLLRIKNCIVFWPEEIEIPEELLVRHVIIKAQDPRQAYAMFFSEHGITYYPEPCEYEIMNGTYIAKGAKIGKNTKLFPYSYIDNQVEIGSNCYIGSGVKILGRVQIGDNVIIRENSVIGADGLTTMRKPDGSPATIPQFGGVVIEDNVQIGANTVIARGAIDDTVIHHGSKIDNLCFVSHNVQIGANTFIVGETIMFGSSSTGEQVYISGNSTIREGIHVGDRALVGMGSVVVKPVPDDAIVKGNPAK